MSSPRGVAETLIVTLALGGCQSQSRVLEVAVTTAGAQIRRQASGQTYEDVARDLEAFVEKEIVFVREKAKAQKEKERSAYRIIGVGGLGLILAGAGVETLPAGVRGGLVFVGVLAAGGGLILYEKHVGEMEACAAFLTRSEGEMKSWGKANLSESGETVPSDLWRDYVDRTAAIERYPKCLRVRRP